ncbi:HDOD domain-containing protein [Marinobacteraceae bacterium S3BR75-40.1]
MLAKAQGDLPSLPQIVLRMLHACDNDADYRDLGEIIGKDTALTARVLSLANSSYFRRGQPVTSIQHALLRLGLNNLRTLVITAALRQFLYKLGADHWQQLRDFWRHSLATALHARALANLTRYPHPDEAFMIGMLHNVGELIALKAASQGEDPSSVADHAETGAKLAEDWGLSPIAIDAIRFQQHAPEEVRDASHLVKLINLATRLAMYDKRGVDAAHTLFGLTAALTKEICTRIDQEVETLADGLAIPLDGDADVDQAREDLLHNLVRHGLVQEAARPLSQAEEVSQFSQAVVSATELLCNGRALMLIADDEWLNAGAVSGWSDLELRLPRDPARSAVARSAESGEGLWIDGREQQDEQPVVDRQLLNLLASAGLYIAPIRDGDQLLGMIVAGFDRTDDPSRQHLVDLLAERAAAPLRKLLQGSEPGDSALTAEGLESQLRMRRLIHEVSNPLTIIRNYLSTLQKKMGEDDEAQTDLDVVREELDRIAQLMMQARDLRETAEPGETADLAREVRSLMDLLRGTYFASHDIEDRVDLPEQPLIVDAPQGALRQILLNLARNAVESMPDGGTIEVQLRPNVWQNNRQWVELYLSDTGPGLPDEVRQQLFQPVKSRKGAGHSGLGLSIVKRLVDDMEGIISCHTGAEGTGFRILVPAANNQGTGKDA